LIRNPYCNYRLKGGAPQEQDYLNVYRYLPRYPP